MMQASCQILGVGDGGAPGEGNTGKVGLIGRRGDWAGEEFYAHFTLTYAQLCTLYADLR